MKARHQDSESSLFLTRRSWALRLSAATTAIAVFAAGWFAWVARTPLDPHEAERAKVLIVGFLLLAVAAAIHLIAAMVPRHRHRVLQPGNWSTTRHSAHVWWTLALLVVGASVAVVFVVRPARWHLRLAMVVNASLLPVDPSGYEVEELPFAFAASFARDADVYFADGDGEVYHSDAREPAARRTRLGTALPRPRMLHVSRRGTIFVSSSEGTTVRSTDGGTTWQECFAATCWRMDEDERSGALYAGWYMPRDHPSFSATVLRTLDEGASWQGVFADEELDHVHTVRWDERWRRLYIACGDTTCRGQAVSLDEGTSWQWLWRGAKQGHTDAALTSNRIIWGSDDYLGRVLTAPRESLDPGRTVLWAEDSQIWFVVAGEMQAFAGTYVERPQSPRPAVLLGSEDEGETWQKVLEFRDGELGTKGLSGDSRRLSQGGWLYFATDTGTSLRVRHRP